MVVRRGRKFLVVSHRTGKVLGTYSSRALAEAALRRHKYFKAKSGAG